VLDLSGGAWVTATAPCTRPESVLVLPSRDQRERIAAEQGKQLSIRKVEKKPRPAENRDECEFFWWKTNPA
jgi:hypothetical protein